MFARIAAAVTPTPRKAITGSLVLVFLGLAARVVLPFCPVHTDPVCHHIAEALANAAPPVSL